MTRTSDLTTINCTSCGAGLDVLGGGRVQVHICPYCGTELDAQDNYKALRTFSDLKRPDSPFSLGASGKIHGVRYVVIGTLESTETYAGRVWTWIDHQIFSPTHGYAFLSLEDGHVIFTRRYRKPGWISEAQVERAETPPSVRVGKERFKYFETSTSTLTFAEGEFSWWAAIGETATTVYAMSDTAMLGFSQSQTERETYISTYLPRDEIATSFGVTLPPITQKVHPLSPFKGGPNSGFVRNWSANLCALCLVIAAVFALSKGDPVLTETGLPVVGLPVEIPFEVTQPNKLVEIALVADVNNSWTSLGLEVEAPDQELLFEVGRTMEFYEGHDDEGHWTEGSRRANLKFVPSVAGTYTLTLGEAESGIWEEAAQRPNRPVSRLDLRIREGQSSGVVPFLAALVFGVFALIPTIRAKRHQAKRWAGGDWDD